MSIVSFPYFAFLAAAFVVYWICSPKYRWIVLFAASIFFAWWAVQENPLLLLVFIAESLLVWFAALLLKKDISEKGKTALTACTIVILIALLILYKDLFFFTSNINRIGRLFRIGTEITAPSWLAPLGISYYTLILIGYLLDVRWGTVEEPQKNPVKFLLFSGFFPQMTSGPFSRYGEISPYLFGDKCQEIQWDLKRFSFGLQRILWGLFKKLVLAERLAVLVGTIYDTKTVPLLSEQYVGVAVIAGAVFYAAQLYMDFSGCMDIVIGSAELFGIPLPENFRQPFFSRTVSEFWRRWHMTLGLWLKDYLFYPVLKSGWMGKLRKTCKVKLGKKAAKDLPTYLGMLILWFSIGFWHGGTWKYIFGTGLYYFIIIVVGLVLKPVTDKVLAFLRIDTEAWSWRFFQRLRTSCLFAIGISFTRFESLLTAFRAWKTVFTDWNPWILFDETITELGLNGKNLLLVAVGLIAVLVVSMLQDRYGSVRELIAKQNLAFRWIVYLTLLFAVLIMGRYGFNYDPSAFIYGGF